MGSVEAIFKQLLSNCEAETGKKLSNLRLAEKRVAYKIESSVILKYTARTDKVAMLENALWFSQALEYWVKLQSYCYLA